MYIITGCLPHLRPLISHYTPAWLKRVVKSSIGSIPTRLTSNKGRSGYAGYGQSKLSRGTITRRDQKQSLALPDDDSIELTNSGQHTLKGAVSMNSMGGLSPTGLPSPEGHVWPHNQAEGEDTMSPRVDIRSSSLPSVELDKQDSPPQTAGHITVTREIKMTRE